MLAIFLVCSTSIAGNCDFPFVKAGILRVEKWELTLSEISNPLSAKIRSPGTR